MLHLQAICHRRIDGGRDGDDGDDGGEDKDGEDVGDGDGDGNIFFRSSE